MTFLYTLLFLLLPMQNSTSSLIETTATILDIENRVSGRRSSAMATIEYTTHTGEKVTSKVRLLHIPFIGSLKKAGDQITVAYPKDSPYQVKSKNDSLLSRFGIYILIALGIGFSVYRFLKK